MKIVIRLNSLTEKLIIKIDDEKLTFLVNEKSKKVDINNFVMRLQVIVSSWEPLMVDDSILDGIEYEVVMKLGDKIKKYIGKNAFPLNYDKFIQLINEVAEW